MSLSIGPISLPIDRLLILVCLAITFIVGAFAAKKDKVSVDGSIAGIFILSMLAARISFVVQYWAEYQQDLWSMIDIRDGGFDAWTAIIVGLVSLIVFAWKQPKACKALIKAYLVGFCVWGITTFSLRMLNYTAQQLPAIMVKQLDGIAVDLNKVEQGKPRVINLWATWCPPCRREMPVLQEAQQEMTDVGFVFVNQGEHSEVIEQFLSREDLALGNVMADTRGVLGYQIGSRALPTTLFINAQGELVDAHLGELSKASLKAKLEKIEKLEVE
ncbi:redoxin [Kangiella profundi]|uniref:Redoxin n=2 Tax=Kangiella profundi TaxID=1561924 RepID=A0A2K9AFB6_9GAMM|nr:redoxin [Kangiella profundi]